MKIFCCLVMATRMSFSLTNSMILISGAGGFANWRLISVRFVRLRRKMDSADLADADGGGRECLLLSSRCARRRQLRQLRRESVDPCWPDLRLRSLLLSRAAIPRAVKTRSTIFAMVCRSGTIVAVPGAGAAAGIGAEARLAWVRPTRCLRRLRRCWSDRPLLPASRCVRWNCSVLDAARFPGDALQIHQVLRADIVGGDVAAR